MREHRKAIQEISTELGIDARVVEEIVRHYFGMVKRIIASGSFFTLGIRGFGTFRPKRHTMKRIIAGEDLVTEMNENQVRYNRKKHYAISKKDVINNVSN